MQRRNFCLFAHFSSFFFCSRCRHLLPSRAAEETGKEGPFGFWVNFFRPFWTLAEGAKNNFSSLGECFSFSLLEHMQLCLTKQHSERNWPNEFICIFLSIFFRLFEIGPIWYQFNKLTICDWVRLTHGVRHLGKPLSVINVPFQLFWVQMRPF